MEQKHHFKIGQSFLIEKPKNTETYLQVARDTEKYIATKKIETEDGIYWKNSGTGHTDLTFYSGSAGVLYFYIKLYQVAKDEYYYSQIEKGERYLAKHWRDLLAGPPSLPLPGTQEGLHFGLGGVSIVLCESYQLTKSEAAKKAIHEIGQFYIEKAKRDERGVYWSGSTGLAMDGGIILTLLEQDRALQEEEIRALILEAAESYLIRGKKKESGSIEYNGFENILPVSLPNYEFGTSGSGYLLTLLYQLTKDKRYLEAAEGCAKYIQEIQIRQEKGYLVPHDIYGPKGEPPVFYLSSCHGPAGTAKLFYQLYQLTGEQKWFDEIGLLVDGMESLGAPEKQSAGLWNNVCFCCGQAGQVQFFLGLYLKTKEKRYLDLARRAAAVLLGEREENRLEGLVYWDMAWERIKPEVITKPIGYYDGAAGVAAVLLQMYLLEKGEFHWNRLLDDPFPEKQE